jgi:glucoamylase
LVGDRLLGEPRFNPDGTPDVQRWSRPQFDGPALRALAGLDAWRLYGVFGRPRPEALAPRLARDLDFTLRHAGTPCIGPWEEPDAVGRHYYVCLAQAGALHHGADWADAASDAATATHYRKAANRLLDGLDEHWSEARGFYVAMREAPGPESALDAAVLLAALDAQLPAGRHSPADPRLRATLTALERHFGDALPINRDRPQGVGIMLGRDVGDRYFGGGAWFPTTLAAARFHYLAGEPDRGDATMRAVRRFAGTDGALSEQVDPTTGAPTSAPNLAWSHAAFIEAALTRPPDAGSRSRGE